ncbi:MAG: OmpA family protein [Rhodospirillaceae bacterium]|nr:OmpA family protein [Rhodospirillaceae bacterium]
MNTRHNVFSYFTAALATLIGGSALAQQDMFVDYNHPNVTIDLSVIEDSGYPTVQGPMLVGPSGQMLLVPGGSAPVSTLHVAPAEGGTLKLVQPAPITKVEKVKAPEIKKAKAPTAPTAPEPAPVKMPDVAEAPKLLEAPAAKSTQQAATSAPPAPSIEPAPEVNTVAEPKVEIPVQAPEIKKQTTEQASLPPAGGGLQVGNVLRITFAADATKLPAANKDELTALAKKMSGENNLRLQLMAYAGGEGVSASMARRMSLSRALSIRSFLIENGVRSTRIDVRALGNKTSEEPLNRVDLNVAER